MASADGAKEADNGESEITGMSGIRSEYTNYTCD